MVNRLAELEREMKKAIEDQPDPAKKREIERNYRTIVIPEQLEVKARTIEQIQRTAALQHREDTSTGGILVHDTDPLAVDLEPAWFQHLVRRDHTPGQVRRHPHTLRRAQSSGTRGAADGSFTIAVPGEYVIVSERGAGVAFAYVITMNASRASIDGPNSSRSIV